MIRRISCDDAIKVAQLESEAAHAPWSAEAIAGVLTLTTTIGWVAESEHGAEAYLLSAVVTDEAEVMILGTHPRARRRGLAAALLHHGARHWAASGVTRAFLEVRADNLPAKRLYTKLGWRPVGRRQRYYADGCDALVLAWEL